MPVKKARNVITPTVPPITASAPVPSVTSASSRRISLRYRVIDLPDQASALM